MESYSITVYMLLSLRIMFLKFVHDVTCISSLFLFIDEYTTYKHKHNLLIPSLIDEYMNYFQFGPL